MLETYQNFRAWLSITENKEYIKNGLIDGMATPEIFEYVNKYFPGMDYWTWYMIAYNVCHDVKMPEAAPPEYEFVTYIVNAKTPRVVEPQNTDWDLTNADDMSLYAIQYKDIN